MVVLLLAAVAVIFLFGAGSVLVNDTPCSRDYVDASDQNVSSCSCTKCDLDQSSSGDAKETSTQRAQGLRTARCVRSATSFDAVNPCSRVICSRNRNFLPMSPA